MFRSTRASAELRRTFLSSSTAAGVLIAAVELGSFVARRVGRRRARGHRGGLRDPPVGRTRDLTGPGALCYQEGMRLVSARDRDPADPYFTRVLTVPNAFTVARLLLLVPVCWLIVAGAPGSWLPVVLLAVWAATDWIDGVLARALDQTSRLGEVMDPIADRIGIVGVTLALAIGGAVDWWILVVIFVVDVLSVVSAGKAARDGSIHVSWLGKVRTAVLLTAIVVVLLGHTVLPAVTALGMTLMLVGVGLHLVAGIDYFLQARRLRRVQTGRRTHRQDGPEEAR